MSFSDTYFSKYISHPQLFHHRPMENTGIIVVIPCFDDEIIFDTLSSLEQTDNTHSAVEVIVVVNSGEDTSEEIVQRNRNIYEKLKKQQTAYKRFMLLPVLIEGTPRKTAGVGSARKTGMDEAVRRFSALDNPYGIIVSLDADTIAGRQYFSIIEQAFKENLRKGAFVFQFRHNYDEPSCTEEEINACKLYEMYLRYYKAALTITGFPYCFHTIGSCFAVNAASYIKAGGMPRRQGGEDFYFLHKLAQITEIGEIDDILVYPSPRISTRVPFGTGPAVKHIISTGSCLAYNFELFLILKQFFSCFESFAVSENTDCVPAEVLNFIGKDSLAAVIEECRQNTNGSRNFIKRLFSKFDAFFIIKFLNSFKEHSRYPPLPILKMIDVLSAYYESRGISVEMRYIKDLYHSYLPR